MKLKIEHCAFAVLNQAGRCIADCHYNKQPGWDRDCTGKSGVTLNSDDRHEVPLAMGLQILEGD